MKYFFVAFEHLEYLNVMGKVIFYNKPSTRDKVDKQVYHIGRFDIDGLSTVGYVYFVDSIKPFFSVKFTRDIDQLMFSILLQAFQRKHIVHHTYLKDDKYERVTEQFNEFNRIAHDILLKED